MIDLRLLEHLCAFADCGTLSGAAQRLHTSQPTLTRSMHRLEGLLGVPLFIRGRNALTLNETGRKAAEYAAYVLAAGADFEEKVRAYDRSLHTLSIGYCAPVPQTVITPLINTLFEGMTISADMTDDRLFCEKLLNRTYQLAVLHEPPDDPRIFHAVCGHEDLYISVTPDSPLASRAEIRLRDLDGLSILLLSRIGFWETMHRTGTPHARYLLQTDRASFTEVAAGSTYPVFSSGYYLRRGESIPGRINIPITDPSCHTDYYLACLASEKERYAPLFSRIDAHTIW